LCRQPIIPSHTSLRFITHNPTLQQQQHPVLKQTLAQAALDAAEASVDDV
jgi:hypothetical protein